MQYLSGIRNRFSALVFCILTALPSLLIAQENKAAQDSIQPSFGVNMKKE